MGFFDSFASISNCPVCGARGAKKFLWMVKCPNSGCAKYDSDYASASRASRIVGKPASEVFPKLRGNFDPGPNGLQIRYTNFRGDELLYTADPLSARIAGEYVVIKVAPSGRHITFKLSSIQNRSEVEYSLPKTSPPNSRERRILKFHIRRGTTSKLFEEVRGKYPDYQP